MAANDYNQEQGFRAGAAQHDAEVNGTLDTSIIILCGTCPKPYAWLYH